MQRSKGFGHGVVVTKICYVQYSDWFCQRFGLQDIDCALRCDMWLVQTNEQLLEIEFLATVSWKWGCQPFTCPRLKISLNAEKRFARHVCLRNPFPPFLFGFRCIQSLPEAWGSWERQHPPPVLHYACIMPIPSLQLQKRDQSHAEKQRVWSRSCVSQNCYNNVSSVTAANKAFSLCRLEVRLPAFQLPIFPECGALRKRDLCDMLICLRNPFPQISRHSFLQSIQLMKRLESR